MNQNHNGGSDSTFGTILPPGTLTYSEDPYKSFRTELAKTFYAAFIASGRKSAVINSQEMTLAKAAFYHADSFIGHMTEEQIK